MAKYTKKQIAANREKWLRDLESGRWPQAKQRLATSKGYCCLGRACEVALKSGVELTTKYHEGSDKWEYGGCLTDLPEAVMDWLGVGSSLPSLTNGEQLDELNDDGVTFKQIARRIRKYGLAE